MFDVNAGSRRLARRFGNVLVRIPGPFFWKSPSQTTCLETAFSTSGFSPVGAKKRSTSGFLLADRFGKQPRSRARPPAPPRKPIEEQGYDQEKQEQAQE